MPGLVGVFEEAGTYMLEYRVVIRGEHTWATVQVQKNIVDAVEWGARQLRSRGCREIVFMGRSGAHVFMLESNPWDHGVQLIH
jgi:hypothetical protein